jgi:hypothetical protein
MLLVLVAPSWRSVEACVITTARPTLRWDVLDPAWLDRAIAYLREQGFVPLIVTEAGDEDRDFRERFRGSHAGALDWPPIGSSRSLEVVRFFNSDDRHKWITGRNKVAQRSDESTTYRTSGASTDSNH